MWAVRCPSGRRGPLLPDRWCFGWGCRPSGAEPLAPGKRFCRACGLAVPGVPASRPVTASAVAEATAPVAERRVCSVLFTDLVGFTPLSESRDPEEVRELLSAYFDRARTVIGRYGGVVEKFIGDAVMAVWGPLWRPKVTPSGPVTLLSTS